MKSMKHAVLKKLAFAAAGALCVAAVAGATDNVADRGQLLSATSTFATLDRNGDHRISRSEAGFDSVLSQTFAEIDTDGDGFVNADEYTAAEKRRTAATNLTNR
jgi:hypothetical protein